MSSFLVLQRFSPSVGMCGRRLKRPRSAVKNPVSILAPEPSDSLNVLKPGRVDSARTKHHENVKEGRNDRALPCHSGRLDVPEMQKHLATKETSGFEPGCHR